MNDYISRQAAIDALERQKDKTAKGEIGSFYNTIIQHDIDVIVELPSAQPEIVRCKDCVHYDLAPNGYNGHCTRQYAVFTAYDFCSYGERRGDAETAEDFCVRGDK